MASSSSGSKSSKSEIVAEMSADSIVAEARMMCCASCGKSELDDVKLMECADCKSVRYCSDDCQQDHRPEHEVKCKERAAELRDEILFRQPESTHLGDCPICCVPLPIEDGENKNQWVTSCCGKSICDGCSTSNELRQFEENMQFTCPFCRHPEPKTDADINKNLMKRVAVNDPVALREMGLRHFQKEEYDKAFEYFSRAAEMGDADAHFNLSEMYWVGHGVEKDEKKKIHHLEEAAIQGHPMARHNLGSIEGNNRRYDRAVKHYIIAANHGEELAVKTLKEFYKNELVSKEDFGAALRAHHAAKNATKSENRERAEKAGAVSKILWKKFCHQK